MSDNTRVIQGINWRQVFPFTHIFRAFRIAIHPSKMILAMLAMISLYLGGRFFDAFWPMPHRALPMEIEAYQKCATNKIFKEQREKVRTEITREYAELIRETKRVKTDPKDLEGMDDRVKSHDAAKSGRFLKEVNFYIVDTFINNEKERASLKRDNQLKRNDADKVQIAAEYEADLAKAYDEARDNLKVVEAVKGVGPFQAFFHYQALCLSDIINSVLAGNVMGGVSNDNDRPGIIRAIVNFVTVAPSWALKNHPLYFFLYGALFLCVWSLFGGAISRIAAVHVADEGKKLSLRQGLDFAIHKFLSFVSAPLIPALIVLIIGAAISLVSFVLMGIPVISTVGQIVVGAALILALIGGLIISLVIIGMAGGFNLMYPTISIEGSDSFDAISRSFSYVYARPWRMFFNTLVGVAYGSVCYLFIRFIIWLILLSTHFFIGLLVFQKADDGGNLLNAIWPAPTFASFSSAYDPVSATVPMQVASFFFHFWVYLVVSVMGAFLISYYFSMNTIIYYLLRKDVDSTEMDDVYWEEPEEEFAEKSVSGESMSESDAPAGQTPENASAPASAEPAPPAQPENPPETPTQST